MDIKPTDLSVKSLLDSGFYKIPRFQRPYSWDRENIEEFWNDAIVADNAEYFIGSFVVYKSTEAYGPLYVVDGQQRLTTITILLAAVRDALDVSGFKQQATGVQQLIERQDINAEKQFVLQTETSYPFLQEHIQKHGTPELTGGDGDEETALKEAYEYLRGQLKDGITAIEKNTSLSKQRKDKDKLAYLLRVRDQVLRLQLIQIQLAKEEEAYLIFETLNTRGKDLRVSDLAKNHLARLMKPKNMGVDILRDKWNEILDLLESSKVELDLNRFLHHAWLSRRNYTGEKQLFAAIKQVVDKHNASKFLDELVSDAKAYRTVFEPEYQKWSKQEAAVEDSLRALQIFRVMQPAPMLLAVVRALLAKKLTTKQAAQVLRVMEHFHLQFTAVTAQRTGGGTAKMYALGGRSLSEASTKDEAAQALKEFTAKLRERVPTQPAFVAGFAELRFSSENTKQKNLVRYILQRIDAHFRAGAPANYEKFSIEHIAAQNPPSTPPTAKFADIGNLILVPDKLNGQLKNEPFTKKKTKMQAEHVPLDPILRAAATWGDREIEERADALGELAYKTIFSV
jgi:uncharacterized protein with ParB-like and HNH nuclease domain